MAGMRTFLGSAPRLKWNNIGGGRYSSGSHGCGDVGAGGVSYKCALDDHYAF